MNAVDQPFTPPAPDVPATDLPLLRFIVRSARNMLSIWPNYAFDVPYSRKRVLGVDAVLLNDPDAIRQVMATNAANYRRTAAVGRLARPLGGSGLFLATGADWKRQRRLLSPSFTPACIGLLLPHFHAAGEHLLRGLDAGKPADLSKAFQDTALEAVLRALFSMPESADRDRIAGLVRGYVTGPGRPNPFDGLAREERSFGFMLGRRDRFQKRWFEAIDAVVATRRAAPNEGGERDLLDLLLNLKDAETGEGLSGVEVRDQCATMLFAGSETTARLLFWACYLLSRDLAEQARVRAEIAAFPPDWIVAMSDLQNWPRLRNVLLEAMRLYPPIPNMTRSAIGPDVICGDPIGAGTQVWISPWVVHRHRKFWERPTAFLPDRFAGKASPWTNMPGYIPFGAGPRICLGPAFALAEAEIVLGRLLSRFRLGLADDRPVLPIGRVTIEPSHEPMFRLEAG